MMRLEAVKAVHDAAVALGADCDPGSCSMWEPFAYDYKSHTIGRTRALMFLHELDREIPPG